MEALLTSNNGKNLPHYTKALFICTIFSLITNQIYCYYQFLFKTFLFPIIRFWPCFCILRKFRNRPNPKFFSCEGSANLILHAQTLFNLFLFPSQNYDLNYCFSVIFSPLYSSCLFIHNFKLPMYIASMFMRVSNVRQPSRFFQFWIPISSSINFSICLQSSQVNITFGAHIYVDIKQAKSISMLSVIFF